MISFVTSNGAAVNVPETMVAAVVQCAERHAVLLGSFLHSVLPADAGRRAFPAAFLLEMAALLELRHWEQEGLRQHLDVDLPSYQEAADDFVARCKKGPEEFKGAAPPLSMKVLRVWLENFAWDGPGKFGANVVLAVADTEEFLNLLADFVWTHRHELEHFLKERPS